MAYSFNQGSSALAASDQVASSTHYPLAKLVYGASGTFNIVSSALPYPVTIYSSYGTQGAVSLVSSGNVTVSSAAPLPVTIFSSYGTQGTVTLISSANIAVGVTAASVSPSSLQPALVVAISPNSVNANGQSSAGGSAPVVLAYDAVNRFANDTGIIFNSSTAITPAFAVITASSMGGGNSVVALSSAKRIRVIAVNLTAAGTVNAKWQSGSSGTDITGLSYLVANAGFILPYNPVGWFQTASSEALHLNLSASIAVGGHITYIAV
jgi:hypothetical protein